MRGAVVGALHDPWMPEDLSGGRTTAGNNVQHLTDQIFCFLGYCVPDLWREWRRWWKISDISFFDRLKSKKEENVKKIIEKSVHQSRGQCDRIRCASESSRANHSASWQTASFPRS